MTMIVNVGGSKYHTTASTLCKAPFFEALLRNTGDVGEERAAPAMRRCEDDDGHLFVDRNGAVFKDILEFLRTGQPVVTGFDAHTLSVEADFYGIKGFQVFEQPMQQKKTYLPHEHIQCVRLEAVERERFHHKTRFYFDEEKMPPHILEHTHKGKRGRGGCLYQEDLTSLGFKRTRHDGSKRTPEGEDDELPCFEAAWRVAWVDLQSFNIVDGIWDRVEIMKPGSVAKVTVYE